jgi:hypothetical protein
MEPIEHAPDDTALRPHDPVEKQPYTRVQRAMVQQWMAGGYLLLFAGLAMGMLISIGVPALPFALLGLIMIAPLLLATASTAVGRYRLAAFWSTLGVVLATLGALAFLYGPLDGYPLLEQVIRSTEGAICSILLALAARSMASATRLLWSAPPPPPQLGPAAWTAQPRLPVSAPANEARDAQRPGQALASTGGFWAAQGRAGAIS